MSFLEKLRNKPQHVKNQYAFFVAVGITLCIALLWSLSLPARFVHMGGGDTTTKTDGESSFLDDTLNQAEDQLGNVIGGTDGTDVSDTAQYPNPYADIGKPNGVENEEVISVPVPSERGAKQTPTTPQATSAQTTENPTGETSGPPNIILKKTTTP